jgi:hypothetical protein
VDRAPDPCLAGHLQHGQGSKGQSGRLIECGAGPGWLRSRLAVRLAALLSSLMSGSPSLLRGHAASGTGRTK